MLHEPHIVSVRTPVRLDRYLTRQLPHVSRNRVQHAIDKGDVLVDGRCMRPSHRLQGGEVLTLQPHLKRDVAASAEAVPLRVVYEDAFLFVIDKPAGLLVHPVGSEYRRTVLGGLHRLLQQRGDTSHELGIVHRLDRGTSGLMMLARTREARRRLSRQVEARQVERTYVAVAAGVPPARRGRVELAIRRHPRRPTRMQALRQDEVQELAREDMAPPVSSSGYSDPRQDRRPRPACTDVELMRCWSGHSMLRLRLETGRTHQIRVHLQAAHLPLVGDPLYGAPPPPPDAPALTFGRPALHARRLSFRHPMHGARLSFRAALPADMRDLLQRIRAAYGEGGRGAEGSSEVASGAGFSLK